MNKIDQIKGQTTGWVSASVNDDMVQTMTKQAPLQLTTYLGFNSFKSSQRPNDLMLNEIVFERLFTF